MIWTLWQCYGLYDIFFNYLLKEKGFKGWIHCFMQVLDIIQDPYLENAHEDINIILAKD